MRNTPGEKILTKLHVLSKSSCDSKIGEHGFLVVDKDPGMTSHDVVAIATKSSRNTKKLAMLEP
jgi:tRNA U55 pseudouridine synthase TruB